MEKFKKTAVNLFDLQEADVFGPVSRDINGQGAKLNNELRNLSVQQKEEIFKSFSDSEIEKMRRHSYFAVWCHWAHDLLAQWGRRSRCLFLAKC